jgi:hypothetical protein
MSKSIYPILNIAMSRLGDIPRYPLQIDEVMESLNLKCEDQFTYTTRYTVPVEQREKVKATLRSSSGTDMDRRAVEEFIDNMEALNWDVSFLVDCY